MAALKIMGGSALALLLAASLAWAQQPPQVIHGTIENVNGSMLTIKPPEGPDVTLRLLENAKVWGMKAATAADVKPNDFIGVGAMPQPDGSQKAVQVTIFSEAQRGTGEGFRPWDRPGSTMTNGTANEVVSSVNGQVMMVKYKGGEQKVIIGSDASIRMYVPGSRDALKPGTKVSVFRPERAPDGTLQAARINYGIGDLVP